VGNDHVDVEEGGINEHAPTEKLKKIRLKWITRGRDVEKRKRRRGQGE